MSSPLQKQTTPSSTIAEGSGLGGGSTPLLDRSNATAGKPFSPSAAPARSTPVKPLPLHATSTPSSSHDIVDSFDTDANPVSSSGSVAKKVESSSSPLAAKSSTAVASPSTPATKTAPSTKPGLKRDHVPPPLNLPQSQPQCESTSTATSASTSASTSTSTLQTPSSVQMLLLKIDALVPTLLDGRTLVALVRYSERVRPHGASPSPQTASTTPTPTQPSHAMDYATLILKGQDYKRIPLNPEELDDQFHNHPPAPQEEGPSRSRQCLLVVSLKHEVCGLLVRDRAAAPVSSRLLEEEDLVDVRHFTEHQKLPVPTPAGEESVCVARNPRWVVGFVGPLKPRGLRLKCTLTPTQSIPKTTSTSTLSEDGCTFAESASSPSSLPAVNSDLGERSIRRTSNADAGECRATPDLDTPTMIVPPPAGIAPLSANCRQVQTKPLVSPSLPHCNSDSALLTTSLSTTRSNSPEQPSPSPSPGQQTSSTSVAPNTATPTASASSRKRIRPGTDLKIGLRLHDSFRTKVETEIVQFID